ncbi:hypothetical protein ACM25N_09165 [Roseovarius sp. C7]|uniref:hypothetical protein n=1 Tax=Roseovarius sp. C7 TaxID=3398643 RepID=UPI0039F6636D
MIATSRWAKLMAATAAVALHGTLVVGFVGKTTVEVESGAGAAEARIGSSFADMAAGTLSAEPAEEMAKPVAQAALVPPTPVETPQEAPQEDLTGDAPGAGAGNDAGDSQAGGSGGDPVA